MRSPTLDVSPVKRDPAARRAVAAWRRLTGGAETRDPDRRTLVACSGGADSTALVLALAGASQDLVVGHVVHDLRPASDTLSERDRVRTLAAGLGIDFVEASVSVRAMSGNVESNARRMRYRELERVAFESGCPFVATGHQAHDQLETMLVAMLRGSGAAGMAGIAPRRPLAGRGVHVVRPMLRLGREDSERLCTLAGVSWAVDESNADVTRMRAAIRSGPGPQLARLHPARLAALGETAANMRALAALEDELARKLLGRAERADGVYRWDRAQLRRQHPAIVAAALRRAHAELHDGRHRDRLPARTLREAVRAIQSGGGETRHFDWRAGELTVDAAGVELRAVTGLREDQDG